MRWGRARIVGEEEQEYKIGEEWEYEATNNGSMTREKNGNMRQGRERERV